MDLFLIMLFVVVFIGYNIGMFAVFKKIVQTQKGKALTAKPLPKLDRTKDWDKEWLEEEERRHAVLNIEPTTLYFFGDTSKPGTEGFKYRCKCGYKGHGLNLDLCQYNFKKHTKDEREKALATLGRFK